MRINLNPTADRALARRAAKVERPVLEKYISAAVIREKIKADAKKSMPLSPSRCLNYYKKPSLLG